MGILFPDSSIDINVWSVSTNYVIFSPPNQFRHLKVLYSRGAGTLMGILILIVPYFGDFGKILPILQFFKSILGYLITLRV